MDANVARRRLDAERERLLEAQEAVAREHLSAEMEDETSAELSTIDQHQADVGSEVFEREKVFSIRDQIEAKLGALQDAFERLRAGTYGRCDTCGAVIPDARLAAEPATRFCVQHERLWELHSMSISFPDGRYTDGARSAEKVAEQEGSHHLEFLPDEDEERPLDQSAEEAAIHLVATDTEPAERLDPAGLELAEAIEAADEAESAQEQGRRADALPLDQLA
jgi:RNA polymerase-binding transcription factor DksA